MPIHKVSGGYKWGSHGKVYPDRKGAERQAAAAHANGFVEKDVLDASLMALSDVTFAETLSKKNTTMGSKDPFAVKRTETGGKMPLPTKRIYVGDSDEPPKGVYVQPGPRGGRFYEVQVGGRASGQPVKAPPKTRGRGEEDPNQKPFGDIEIGRGGKTSRIIEEPNLRNNTIQVIRTILAREHIYPAKQQEDGTISVGYTLGEYHGDYDVRGTGPSKELAIRLTRKIGNYLSAAGLQIERHGGIIHVKPLPGDPKAEIGGLTEIHRSVVKSIFEDDIMELIDRMQEV